MLLAVMALCFSGDGAAIPIEGSLKRNTADGNGIIVSTGSQNIPHEIHITVQA